ncbi:hypothetical protein C9422_18490 [Pseudomonas sp. B1(2018)]|uniref:hypothetical protein n=1 Tax=Pseudomonas sp. B1(2018) TaxID=2233856 RepID=UPI000D5CA816|nr:hypothetical protein [Pseudomonas sp. B1(2018)]PVZ56512.1 hypothetical protein C9422_18490 [Pseudomonas sp. B1(2018)]
MKARIEKKLSKRLFKLHPSLYRRAWIDKDEPSELAYEQRTRVSHVWSVGGGTDYWGDGMDAYTVWADWKMNWAFHGPFEPYPHEHNLAYYPNTEGFQPTTRNLLKLAAECELASEATA